GEGAPHRADSATSRPGRRPRLRRGAPRVRQAPGPAVFGPRRGRSRGRDRRPRRGRVPRGRPRAPGAELPGGAGEVPAQGRRDQRLKLAEEESADIRAKAHQEAAEIRKSAESVVGEARQRAAKLEAEAEAALTTRRDQL